jgi:signal transduction histidine kinase
MLQAHERDRQLIAYEIHDGLVQDLTGAHLHVETARRQSQSLSAAALAEIDSAERLLGHSIVEARRLISGLRPPILDEHGVVAAIEFVLRDAPLAGGGVIEFKHKVRFDRLSPLLEATIFRIVQEAVNNIRRHSGATRAEVALHEVDDRIHLDVRDWGCGFDPAAIAENRFGLQGIRERARLLRGAATISSAPGKGTHLAVELPITYSLARANEGEDS